MNLIRDDAIYVSRTTRKMLSYCTTPELETIDAVSEKVLADWIKEHYPRVVEHVKGQYEQDKQFREGMKNDHEATN